jgi:choline dehydrogenase-like flavoprotein
MRARVKREPYDAIVVGSGITGGWAAKELCERGLRTLVLEAGRDISPGTDYVEHVQPWQQHFRGFGDRRRLEREQAVQKHCYACDEWGSKFFVNDLENPYAVDEGKPFQWIRGRQVGGRSIMWGRQVYRWSDLDFEANLRDGHGVDWPIRYADIEPWYDYVERFIGISGTAEGLPQLPDGQFLPGMQLNCAELKVRDALQAKWGRDRVLTIGRCAILTRTHGGRAACHYCGPCERGCITGSYFSSISSTLPAARRTGRLTLRPDSVVESVLFDPATRKARGVRVIDAGTTEAVEFEARLVFLCASTLESTRILLNSTSAEFPAGLANSSGVLGQYLMDHTMGGGASGRMDGMLDQKPFGNRPNGVYVPRFRNVKDQHPDFLRGYAFQGGAGRAGWGRGGSTSGIGAEFKASLLEPGTWSMGLYGFGECLPRRENAVSLDPVLRDKWGVPALRISCAWGENERAALRDMSVTAAEMLEAAGAQEVSSYVQDNPPGLTIHEMGTARMGRDPATSVLNGFNQAHDVANLFVTDGACMASSANQNPSITYMALTARAVDYAVGKVNRHEL